MKRIVLKPEIKPGDEILYKDKVYIVDCYDEDTIFLKSGEELFPIDWDDILYIIESREESKCWCQCTENHHSICNNCGDLKRPPVPKVAKVQDHVADGGKMVKPPVNEKIKELYQELQGVYSERAKILAAFAHNLHHEGKVIGVAKHTEEDKNWDDEWRTILVINLPYEKETWQLTWHFHDSEKYLLDGLPVLHDYKWDGHTTDEKYKKLLRYYLPQKTEEKPPLNLRVGVTYKCKDKYHDWAYCGTDVITAYEPAHPYPFKGQMGNRYKENGESWGACNAIEEVQSESKVESVTKKEFEKLWRDKLKCSAPSPKKAQPHCPVEIEHDFERVCVKCNDTFDCDCNAEYVSKCIYCSQKEMQPEAQENKVEYSNSKTIPLGKDSRFRYEEPYLQCQGCLELNLLTSPWKWCDRHSLIYKDFWSPDAECPACYYYESYKKLIDDKVKKSEGNPFKGGAREL